VIDETAGPGRAGSVTGAQSVEPSKPRAGAGKPQRTNGTAAKHLQPAAAARPIRRPGGNASPGARAFGVVGISLGTHMAIMGLLGFMPTPNQFFASHKVEMEVISPEPPPPPPPPKVEEVKPPDPEPPRPKAAPKPAPKPAEPEPPKAEAKPAPEAPVDLTGVTLTGGDSAWSSVVGSGGSLTGPAPRVASNTGRDRTGSTAGIVGGKGDKPVIVAEASLSRAPVPPDGMNGLLEQNFPPRARAQGVSGSALLRVTILSDGRVGDMRVMRETGDYGFGAACQKMLRLRRWQPPLDRRGQPVATEVRYSCEFEVAY
jgi:protein TonB